MPRTGEEIQALGVAGTERAKRWLEATCRAEVKWNNPNVGRNKLQFPKAGASPNSEKASDFFSFDLGGTLLGGDVDGDMFVAEVKKYSSVGDQASEYRNFLAQCYCVEALQPNMYEHYLWITWTPFLVGSWSSLFTKDFVLDAITSNDDRKAIALGDQSPTSELAEAVSNKLLIVVLSERQELVLSLHGNELLSVRQALLEIRDRS